MPSKYSKKFLAHFFSLSKPEKIIGLFSIAFLIVSLLAILYKDTYYLFIFPIFIILVYLYFTSEHIIFLSIAFLTPLSVSLSNWDARLSVTLPTEPLLAGLLLMYLLKTIYSSKSWKLFWRNPVTIFFMTYFLWLFINIFTSQMPIVSLKFLVSHLWLMVPMYFLGTELFYNNEKTQKNFILLQIIPLFFVVIYSIVRHLSIGLHNISFNWTMQPFYKEHGTYGSAIALFIPIIIILTFNKSYSFSKRFFFACISIVFLLGLTLSFSRASWVGVFIALYVGFIAKFRIKFRTIAIGFFALLLIFVIFQRQFFEHLKKNNQDSSKNLVENIQSISNISTDASNLERINRWSCAFRIVKDYPFFGIGAGTYQFLYAPYQRSGEKTVISTNAGTLGNSHSEYLSAMSETGIPGALFFICIVVCIFIYGFKTYSSLRKFDINRANFILSINLGLITYFTHAFLNNFLDTDKIAVPVWGFAAIIIANWIYVKGVEKVE